MYQTKSETQTPPLTRAERRLVSLLIDHWDQILASLQSDPRLYRACERLLNRYGQDMVHRIEALSDDRPRAGWDGTDEKLFPAIPVCDEPGPLSNPQRRCDVIVLRHLLPRIHAA